MVLSLSGLSASLALQLVDKTYDRQIAQLRSEPQHERAEAAFRERIAAVTSPKDFIDDYEVYSFVMRAFDLEDQIFGKAMMRRILESDPNDPKSLVNKLVDPRFKAIHKAMGFGGASGTTAARFSDPSWQDAIVDRYYRRMFINVETDENETVGMVLEFREKVAGIRSWYDVLKDKELSSFFRTALSLPDEMATLDVDRQKRILEGKFDIAKLADPEEQTRLVRRFIAISEATGASSSFSSPAVSLLTGAASLGTSGLVATLNIEPVKFSASRLYR
ncbi:MAG: DUF1217 domain-containing protein [Alphaproteobacteria bacterium]|nr:MAG: DUF1217 domain-containing protein [Alphaproteobacteria bacterium]